MSSITRLVVGLFTALGLAIVSGVSANAAILDGAFNSADQIRGQSQNEVGFPLGYFVGTPAAPGGNLSGIGGSNGSRVQGNVVIGFLLPVLPAGEVISNATFTVEVASTSIGGGATGPTNIDLYGLNTTNPDGSGAGLFYASSTPDASQVLLEAAITNSGAAGGTVLSDDVTAFIQSLYTDNTPNQVEVFFRLNASSDLDIAVNSNVNRVNYAVNSTVVAPEDLPTLVIETVIPEPASLALLGLGGLCMLSRRCRDW